MKNLYIARLTIINKHTPTPTNPQNTCSSSHSPIHKHLSTHTTHHTPHTTHHTLHTTHHTPHTTHHTPHTTHHTPHTTHHTPHTTQYIPHTKHHTSLHTDHFMLSCILTIIYHSITHLYSLCRQFHRWLVNDLSKQQSHQSAYPNNYCWSKLHRQK